jgi:hypothetical protein
MGGATGSRGMPGCLELLELMDAAEQALARARATHLMDGGAAASGHLAEVRARLEVLDRRMRETFLAPEASAPSHSGEVGLREELRRRLGSFQKDLLQAQQLLAHGAAVQSGWAQVLEAALVRDRAGAAYGPAGIPSEARALAGMRMGWEA